MSGEVMQGFWYIHRCGVQHKDPSERNVLQDETNKNLIIDFDVARLQGRMSKSERDRTGST